MNSAQIEHEVSAEKHGATVPNPGPHLLYLYFSAVISNMPFVVMQLLPLAFSQHFILLHERMILDYN